MYTEKTAHKDIEKLIHICQPVQIARNISGQVSNVLMIVSRADSMYFPKIMAHKFAIDSLGNYE